jgi:hypothetical protein
LLSRSAASTTDSDATSLRAALLHPLLPASWKLVGRQCANDALYCVHTDTLAKRNSAGHGGRSSSINSSSSSSSNDTNAGEKSDWLVYVEERWQTIGNQREASICFDTLFHNKHVILLACPVASLVATVTPTLTFRDEALTKILQMYSRADDETLYPFLILLEGKTLKTPTRQAIARHLFSLGFLPVRVHWQGLSSKADAMFVQSLTRMWHSISVCKL